MPKVRRSRPWRVAAGGHAGTLESAFAGFDGDRIASATVGIASQTYEVNAAAVLADGDIIQVGRRLSSASQGTPFAISVVWFNADGAVGRRAAVNVNRSTRH